MPAPDYEWSVDPLYGEVLQSGGIAAVWASLALAGPWMLLGSVLVVPTVAGGFGLSASELLIVVVTGAVVGALLIAATAWAGAAVAVPGAVLLRPTFGYHGAAVVSLLLALFLIGLAGFELRAAADALTRALESIDVPSAEPIGWVAAVAVSGVLVVVGIVASTRFWIRRVAIWGALGLTIVLFWRLGATGGLSFQNTEDAKFVQALDLVASFAALFFPLVPAISRFAGAPSVAASATSWAMVPPVVLATLVGAGAAVNLGAGSSDLADLIVALLAGAGGVGFVVLLLGWIVLAELDQPLGYLHAAGGFVATWLSRAPHRLVALVALVAAVVVGLRIEPSDALAYARLGVAGMLPIAAVFLADFFVLRDRSYGGDAMFNRKGGYRGVNYLAFVVVVAGFVVYQSIDPVGPWGVAEAFRDWYDGRPLSVRIGEIPAGLVTFGISFLVYAGLGRWLVRAEEVSVTRITGRF